MFDTEHTKTTLDTIHELNYGRTSGPGTNYMRTYATRGERGHIVMAYPNGRPEHPMPYWPEVWTGLEYVYAIGLIQQGRAELAEDGWRRPGRGTTGAARNPSTRPSAATTTPGPWPEPRGGADRVRLRRPRQGLMTFAEATPAPAPLVLVDRLGLGHDPPGPGRRPPRSCSR